MKFSVACNFDSRLIEAIREYPVYEVYGKMTSDVAGGGRASFTLPSVGRKKIRRYVKLAHGARVGFNYLLNASCLANAECTRSGQRDLRRLLDWLAELGVDSVTLNHPLLLKTIKKSYPFKIRIGVFAAVNTVQRARFWEEEGADCICLEDITVNRDFHVLSRIRESVRCDLQLLVNNSCFYSCWMSNTHMNMLSHASQSKHGNRGFCLDYCVMRCSREKLKNPLNYIRASWIRPEDLSHYRAMGYGNFKIVERNAPTSLLALRVRAYAEGRYQGNLLDLVQSYGYREDGERPLRRLGRMARYFLRPRFVNPFKLAGIRELAEKQGMLSPLRGAPPVMIRNEDLNGFLAPFLSESCGAKDCSACRYCHSVAERHVKIDPAFREECLGLYSELTEDMESGALWS